MSFLYLNKMKFFGQKYFSYNIKPHFLEKTLLLNTNNKAISIFLKFSCLFLGLKFIKENILDNNCKLTEIVKGFKNKLECRDKESLKNISNVKCYEEVNRDQMENKYPNLKIIRSNAFKNLLNQVRDKHINTSEFRKLSKRLIRILLEEALAFENNEEIIKESPCGYYRSMINTLSHKDYIAVSILRSGDAMLEELVNIMPDVMIGKILVQRNEESESKEALYFFDKLPNDIGDKKAIVLDPMIATGGSVLASIDILIKKGVKEENIIFINIISVEDGIKALFSKYPKLKMVTGICDPELLPIKYIAPGLGDFGDRFYGTH